MHPTATLLRKTDFPPIRRGVLDTLQVNLGYRCNQTCQHCHVNAGPNRTEAMDGETAALVLEVLKAKHVKTLDLTGGAPELNPHFRTLVQTATALGCRVIDRCNLTVLLEPGQQGLAEFLALHRVEITASLPCYLQENVDRQRGGGVFDKSIAALCTLNALGYGKAGTGLVLNLVYNPAGPTLPPEQEPLEAAYRKELEERYGIAFSHLYVLANMPIHRFGSMLVSKAQFVDYMKLLKTHFNAQTLNGVMCRTLASVDWQGYLYDCDFNQMLQMPMCLGELTRPHLRDLLQVDLVGLPISVADHCYGCTAGQGSSCGGALAA